VERGHRARVAARERGEDGALSWGAGGGRRDGVEVGIEEGNPRIVYIYIVICGTHMS
jgi:hypothetical protein